LKPFNAAIADFENTMEIISGVRTIRKDKNIPFGCYDGNNIMTIYSKLVSSLQYVTEK
jgi:valyl-tRNA synthetase